MSTHYPQTGASTQQMQKAPVGAVYIWANRALTYPKNLARRIGRDDLKIVSPEWLDSSRYQGYELTGVVVDHATLLTEDQRAALEMALTSVR